MSNVEYVAWLRRKDEVLVNYIVDSNNRLHNYRDIIGRMAEGMSTYGRVEYDRQQIAHAMECERRVSADVMRKTLILTATRNEIMQCMADPTVTDEAVRNYMQENMPMLDERANDYWDVLCGG
jgi:hypothetical protein